MDLLSLLVSITAVAVSLWATWRVAENSREANRLLEENNKLNERLVVLEEERRKEERGALQRAYLNISKGDSYDARRNLIIENVGPGIAHDVKVEPGRFQVFNSPFPKPRLAKGEREILTYRHGCITPFRRGGNVILITWKHPSGEIGEREVSVP